MFYAKAIINTKALVHNLGVIRQLAPEQKILAMVKADAYGHGLITCAKALAEASVDGFGVARIAEAMALRDAGISQTIVLMDGIIESQELQLAAEHGLDIVIHRPEQIELLQSDIEINPIQIWLKIDTGMNRLGLNLNEAKACWDQLLLLKNIKHPPRIMTHFARADERDDDFTQQQMNKFFEATASMPGEYSLANSAGILAWPESYGDWLRPGIMLYGASPFAAATGTEHELQPVMTLKSQLIAIKRLQQGEAIGYGSTWVCPEPMCVGVVAIGYGDGYPRHIAQNTPVLLNGELANIVGRVSMDMVTIDLRQHPKAKVGDEVTLWGEGLPVEVIARQANTISYELLCQVTARVVKCFESN